MQLINKRTKSLHNSAHYLKLRGKTEQSEWQREREREKVETNYIMQEIN